MIRKIAAIVSARLVEAKVIKGDDRSLYEFAAYSLLFGLLPVFLTLIYSSIMGLLLEGILMIIPFMLIRKFSGGFHLESSKICFCFSSAIIIVSLIAIEYLMKANNILIPSVGVVISTVIICVFSPIDSDARKLSAKEIRTFGMIARILATLFSIIYFSLLFFRKCDLAIPIGVGAIMPALLQIPCFFSKKQSHKRAELSPASELERSIIDH